MIKKNGLCQVVLKLAKIEPQGPQMTQNLGKNNNNKLPKSMFGIVTSTPSKIVKK